VSFLIGGNSSKKNGGVDGSSHIECPLIVCDFALLNLLSYLINCSHFQYLVPETVVHRLFYLFDSLTTSEEVSY
jgi:hypothetical protein